MIKRPTEYNFITTSAGLWSPLLKKSIKCIKFRSELEIYKKSLLVFVKKFGETKLKYVFQYFLQSFSFLSEKKKMFMK